MSQAQQSGREEQLVAFRLADECYGLDINVVQEIITWQPVTRVPRTPSFVEGLINLRGRVIPVIDLRKRFGLNAADAGRDTRIVIAEMEGLVVGLVVDGVSEVLRVPSERIDPPSGLIIGIETEFIRGVAKMDDRLIILMDAQKILTTQEQNDLVVNVG